MHILFIAGCIIFLIGFVIYLIGKALQDPWKGQTLVIDGEHVKVLRSRGNVLTTERMISAPKAGANYGVLRH